MDKTAIHGKYYFTALNGDDNHFEWEEGAKWYIRCKGKDFAATLNSTYRTTTIPDRKEEDGKLNAQLVADILLHHMVPGIGASILRDNKKDSVKIFQEAVETIKDYGKRFALLRHTLGIINHKMEEREAVETFLHAYGIKDVW
ncbi:hypothetical protein HK102_002371 [Quaeritorhiza haematococci]|nr:hypothetical protein HK102_002371 [Quaeritorhiza haematococci]